MGQNVYRTFVFVPVSIKWERKENHLNEGNEGKKHAMTFLSDLPVGLLSDLRVPVCRTSLTSMTSTSTKFHRYPAANQVLLPHCWVSHPIADLVQGGPLKKLSWPYIFPERHFLGFSYWLRPKTWCLRPSAGAHGSEWVMCVSRTLFYPSAVVRGQRNCLTFSHSYFKNLRHDIIDLLELGNK